MSIVAATSCVVGSHFRLTVPVGADLNCTVGMVGALAPPEDVEDDDELLELLEHAASASSPAATMHTPASRLIRSAPFTG